MTSDFAFFPQAEPARELCMCCLRGSAALVYQMIALLKISSYVSGWRASVLFVKWIAYLKKWSYAGARNRWSLVVGVAYLPS